METVIVTDNASSNKKPTWKQFSA